MIRSRWPVAAIAVVTCNCSISVEFPAFPEPVGDYPSNYQEIAKAHLPSVFQFDSAEYTFVVPPKLAYRRDGSSQPVGWLACGTVDIHKREYTHKVTIPEPFSILFRNSKIVEAEFGTTDNTTRCLAGREV